MKTGNGMGEVQIKVRLTNLFDEERAAAGEIKRSRIRSFIAKAVVDTGATRSALPPKMVKKLGLTPRRQQAIELANGRKETVGLANGIMFRILGRDAEEDVFVVGNEVLIGQTVLEKMDLLVDCKRRRLVPAHPDQALNKLK